MYLGVDLSTQQLKAVLVNDTLVIVLETAVHFDHDLPHYGTLNGACTGPSEGEVTSPVAMWLEAIDLLVCRIAEAGVDLGDITAISGAGQQHGSVYWSIRAEAALAALDPEKSLLEQLGPVAFAYPKAPIWQDHSTTSECTALEDAFGGPEALADMTGSRAHERFTGNQIARIRRMQPDVYAATVRVSLVSSFLTSLFLGHIAPIEVADASGMNLTNVLTGSWHVPLLDFCGGPELRAKLGPEPVKGGTVIGTIAPWWVTRWGFSPACAIAPFTGDNPASVVGLSAPGDALLSLGTSTTLLLALPPSPPSPPPIRLGAAHLLPHPVAARSHIAMICYANGSLARQRVRDLVAGEDWVRFEDMVTSSPPGGGDRRSMVGIFWDSREIIPPGGIGHHYFSVEGLDQDANEDQSSPVKITRLDSIPMEAKPRAILESQFLSIRAHIAAFLPAASNIPSPDIPSYPPLSSALNRLLLIGGASGNKAVQRVAADVLGLPVYVSATREAAALGGAMLAKYAVWKVGRGAARSYGEDADDSFQTMVGPEGPSGMHCVAHPNPASARIYDRLVAVYLRCEEKVMRKVSESG